MAADKNLFLYDLAVVSIMKNEAPYVKEWLDYHLLAGVNHFYVYDNDSPDNLKEVLQPYIERGIVTYHYYPGKARQYEAYNEAIQNYRFFCRYMAFIDADEFIFPQSNRPIVEVVDEILNDKPNAGGLAVNIFGFGSNYQDKADYSRGVLERFTRRAPTDYAPPLPVSGIPGGTAHVSTITIPRKVNYFFNPHFAVYYEGYVAVNENGGVVPLFSNNPPTVDKIVMNHYSIKSLEEYIKKVGRGTADAYHNIYKLDGFSHDSPDNEVFDDSILKYRVIMRSQHEGGGSYNINYQKVFNSVSQNLSMMFTKNTPLELLIGKLETFLTCRAVIAKLRENVIDDFTGNFFEELALNAIHRTLFTQVAIADIKLLFSELPAILTLNYPVVQSIRESCIILIPQIINFYSQNGAAKDISELEYLLSLLKASNVIQT